MFLFRTKGTPGVREPPTVLYADLTLGIIERVIIFGRELEIGMASNWYPCCDHGSLLSPRPNIKPAQPLEYRTG